jgi:UDP-N-acetylmuramyl pentapeptide phosphotransferase/UDP-N-acetylglucosamine-1-phosphate transferase
MRYGFLRTSSKIITGIGALIAALSVIVGMIALVNRPEGNDGLMVATVIVGGLISGIIVAAAGQLLQLFVDLSDEVQKIQSSTAELLASRTVRESSPRESLFA